MPKCPGVDGIYNLKLLETFWEIFNIPVWDEALVLEILNVTELYHEKMFLHRHVCNEWVFSFYLICIMV